MYDAAQMLEFAVDIVTMMPPIEAIEAVTITREQAIMAALGSLALLVVAITAMAMKEMFNGGMIAALIAAGCITAIGFVGLGQETLKTIFVTSYPPMVMAIRFAEGAIIGQRVGAYFRWWHLPAFACFVIGLYYAVRMLPEESLALAKGAWALLGAGLAAFLWSRMFGRESGFQHPLVLVGLFAVFASTLIYVAASPFEREVARWVLPVGLALGLLAARKQPHVRQPQ